MSIRVLTLNAGSSSVKYGVYAVGTAVTELSAGSISIAAAQTDLFAQIGDVQPEAIGHRIVHGGADLFAPVRIDQPVLAKITAAARLAPLHAGAALGLIAAATQRYPRVPNVACFDTGFHHGLPAIAATLPIPEKYRVMGLRRYGFHGLSCEAILHQLGDRVPQRLIIAHLGSGASVTAVRAGKSVDTSMGLTPAGGVIMGSRAGDLDPGVLLFLMRDLNMTAEQIEDTLVRQSGLLGISGKSADLRALHQADDPMAALAVRMFCRSVSKQIAGMMAVLGGADLIVFTGGIGEHDALVCDAICADLAFAGAVPHVMLPAREGEQIARNVAALLCPPAARHAFTVTEADSK